MQSILNNKYIPSFIRIFLTSGNERSVNAKLNIVGSFLFKGGNILIGLILVPLTINYVNPEQYGIWLTLSSIIMWMSFFDIGLGNGLRNKFAEARVSGKHELARIYISTTYAILSLIGISLILVFVIINQFIDWSKILNASGSLSAELNLLALIVFVLFCFQFVLQLITSIVIANQQSALASAISFSGNLLSLLSIYILIHTTQGSLLLLGIAYSTSPIIAMIVISLWLYKKQLKQYRPSIKSVQFKFAKNLLGLGSKFFIIQIAALILYQTSNIIIAQLFGPTDVTSYNIAFRYFSVASMVFMIILSPFWSAYTEAYAKGEISWIQKSIKHLKLLSLLAFTVIALMVLISKLVYHLWIGDVVQIPIILSIIIALNTASNIWNAIFLNFLNGIGKIRLQLLLTIFIIFVNIPLSIVLAKYLHFGASGVILGSLFCNLIFSVISPLQYHLLITNKAKGVWSK